MTHEKMPARRRHHFHVIPAIALSMALLVILTSAGCAPPEGESDERAKLLAAIMTERLAYRAHAHLVSEGLTEPAIQVQLEARHLGRQPIHINYDLCGIRLALYRDGSARHLAWRASLGYATSYVDRAGPITVAACGGVRRVATIDPGDAFFPPEFSARYPISQIMGHSLDAGWYYAMLDLDVREGTSVAMRIAAGWLFIPDDLRPVGQLTARRESPQEAGDPGLLRMRSPRLR